LSGHAAKKFKQYLENNLKSGMTKVEQGAVLRFINALWNLNLNNLEEFTCIEHKNRKFVVPPLFLITFDRERRPTLDDRYGKGAVNLGNAFEFYQDLFVDDLIIYEKKISKFEEKKSSLGDAAIYTIETPFWNHKKQKVAIGKWTTMVFLEA